MREIKFRGIMVGWGGWAFGMPLFDTMTGKAAVIVDFVDVAELPESMALMGFEEVDVNTVSQYTGLKDKNGKEIYEGDKDAFGNVVEWCNDGWCLNGDRPLSIFLNSFEIIGNIYESPELLNNGQEVQGSVATKMPKDQKPD